MKKEKREIDFLLEEYDKNNLSLGALGSHSALDVCKGAQMEGIPNFVVAKRKRDKTYCVAFRERNQGTRKVGAVQDVHIVNDWKDVFGEKAITWIRKRNGVIVPSRSLAVYLRDKNTGTYDSILGMHVPFFGNINLLRAEERAKPYIIDKNQDFLVRKANLPIPTTFATPEEINKPALIKASQFSQERDFERDFIIVDSSKQYYKKLEKAVNNAPANDKAFVEALFRSAPIQEYIKGGLLINLNFFYSPTWDDLELLGTDTRAQFGNKEEATHTPISLRESLLEQAIDMGYKLIETVARYYPQGLIGPFAIQCMGDTKETLRPIDLSLRIPGSPDVGATPYPIYLHGERVDFGKRIAMELKDAVQEGTLNKVLS